MKAYHLVKPALDFIFALLLALALSPFLLMIAVIVKLDSRGPVLFKQTRIGKNKKEFQILKYRTMRTDTPKEVPTHLFHDSQRYITRTGRFLRKSSLDELPQLFNILTGDMSFIGPRPALWNQYDLLEERESQASIYGTSANSIKPGITGWAQVNGRDELPIKEKASYDCYYAGSTSFCLDLRILVKTFSHVIRAEGVIDGKH